MRKLIRNIRSKVATATRVAFARTFVAVSNARAEGFVDTGVKILTSVVIGALVLAGLYSLFNTSIMPTLTTKIQELFNYSG